MIQGGRVLQVKLQGLLHAPTLPTPKVSTKGWVGKVQIDS